MSGIIAVYGLVMAVLIAGSLNPLDDYSLYKYFLSRPLYHPCLPLGGFLCAPRLTRQWNNTSIIRDVCWIDWLGGRLLYRDSRRSRRTQLSPSAEDLCGFGSYFDICRGLGIIWVDCRVDIEYTRRTSAMLAPSLGFVPVIDRFCVNDLVSQYRPSLRISVSTSRTGIRLSCSACWEIFIINRPFSVIAHIMNPLLALHPNP